MVITFLRKNNQIQRQIKSFNKLNQEKLKLILKKYKLNWNKIKIKNKIKINKIMKMMIIRQKKLLKRYLRYTINHNNQNLNN